MKNRKKPFIIIGSGGHAKVVLDLLEEKRENVYGIIAKENEAKEFFGYPIIGNDANLNKFQITKFKIAIGIGFTSNDMSTRERIFYMVRNIGFEVPELVHPSAIISKYAKLSMGCHVLAGSKIGVETKIGMNSIVNTCASVDHDTTIGAHCHIAPGVVVCGSVKIEEKSFVGAGSTVIENISISKNIIIGAGSVVVKDIKKSGIYFGNPAKKK